ncbi:hypothetical protein ACIQF6_17030 [Kitasatospora sp. NPDC092948]|uniref:hypothetical protein n=1 Tax=Kitasatospora sp. NPDC092948 TaxID=3364088 RepID=UPI003830FA16
MSPEQTPHHRPGPAEHREPRRQTAEPKDNGHTTGRTARNPRTPPGTTRRPPTTPTCEPGTPDPDRPTWLTGTDDKLTLLRRAAQARGVVLDAAAPPTETDAQELTDELADLLLSGDGFEADWEITQFGDLVESLIDALNRYAYPD